MIKSGFAEFKVFIEFNVFIEFMPFRVVLVCVRDVLVCVWVFLLKFAVHTLIGIRNINRYKNLRNQ